MARLNTRPSVSSSRWQSATPQRDNTSDQENRDPKATAQPDKQRPMERSKLPTPGSDNSNASRGQKRKRAGPEAHATQGADKEHSAKFNKYFDPNQDPQLRREVKRKSRALERNFQGSQNVGAARVRASVDVHAQKIVTTGFTKMAVTALSKLSTRRTGYTGMSNRPTMRPWTHDFWSICPTWRTRRPHISFWEMPAQAWTWMSFCRSVSPICATADP